MEPQILAFDGQGRHNADLEGTAKRLATGAAWKKQRLIVVIPASGSIPTKVAMSHWSLAFPPNQAVQRIAAIGMEVGEAYSRTLEQVLAHPEMGQWEYLLTLEHDNLPPADGVLRLIAQMEQHPEFAAIGGLYFTKGEGGCAQIWGDPKDPTLNFRPLPPDAQGGLVECNGTGMGFTMFRLSMFRDEKIERPWFKTTSGPGGTATQDLHFWSNAKKAGHRCAVDCSIRVGHYDLEGKFGIPDFTW
jgi:hypothetical protein